MISKTKAGFDVICDLCPRAFLELDSPEHEWSDVMSEMAAAGWASIKNNRGEWKHYCRNCKLALQDVEA